MTEWLDLMLDEVRRKSEEAADAADEAARRESEKTSKAAAKPGK